MSRAPCRCRCRGGHILPIQPLVLPLAFALAARLPLLLLLLLRRCRLLLLGQHCKALCLRAQ